MPLLFLFQDYVGRGTSTKNQRRIRNTPTPSLRGGEGHGVDAIFANNVYNY
jgi:hypothetical protein